MFDYRNDKLFEKYNQKTPNNRLNEGFMDTIKAVGNKIMGKGTDKGNSTEVVDNKISSSTKTDLEEMVRINGTQIKFILMKLGQDKKPEFISDIENIYNTAILKKEDDATAGGLPWGKINAAITELKIANKVDFFTLLQNDKFKLPNEISDLAIKGLYEIIRYVRTNKVTNAIKIANITDFFGHKVEEILANNNSTVSKLDTILRK